MLRGRSYGGPHAQAAGIVYCWEFQADGAAFTIEPPGGIAVNGRPIEVRAAGELFRGPAPTIASAAVGMMSTGVCARG